MRMAAWLLSCSGVDDALIGDLVEQRHAGRSRAWLWRQAAGAIVAALVRDAAVQPLRTAAAVIVALVLRQLTIRAWGVHELSVDSWIVEALRDSSLSLSRPAYLVALSWTNNIVLAPAWFVMGFVLGRVSSAAAPIFLLVAVALLMPHVMHQLHGAMASDMVRWLLPVQLTIFGSSIGTFVISTLVGAACGLGQRHEIV